MLAPHFGVAQIVMFGFRTGNKKKKEKKGSKKRLFHRDPRMNELNDEEKLRLLAELARLRAAGADASKIAITCRNRTDGAGAQALGILSELLWVDATGMRYLHTPFSIMAHAIGSRREWAERWERFFNLGRGEVRVPPNAPVIPARDFLLDPEACIKAGAVLAAPAFHWSEFQTPEALQRMRPRLRAKYYASRKPDLAAYRGPPGTLNVAVHVRRGDVTAEHELRWHYYTQDAPILATIESMRSVAAALGRPVRVNLFSEGPAEMFAAFAAADCQLYLDSDPFEAFHNLVNADILVQAKSSFSYMAGMISTGAVLHERYVHQGGSTFYRPVHGWIVRDEAGALDTEGLRGILEAKSAEKLATPWHLRPLGRLKRWLLPA